MENTYLVCFEFDRLWKRYDPDDEYNSEMVEDFMLEFYGLDETLIKLFPNFTIPIAHNSFLIKTLLKSEELSELLLKEVFKVIDGKDGDSVKRQIYVAEIKSLVSYTHRRKKIEIEYLNDAISKHN